MANRRFVQFSYGLEKAPVQLYAQVAIGATGAPTLNIPNSKGIASVVRNGVGKYTITLMDQYVRFMLIDNVVANTTGIPLGVTFGVVGTPAVGAAAPTIVVQFSSAGSAVELASGDTCYFNLVLSNSTAP